MAWLLPTRGRPELTQQMLDACHATGMTTPAVLLIDPRGGAYPEMRADSNWTIERMDLDMADAMRWFFDTRPNDQFYGWLSDDLHPRTANWDTELVASADSWFLACCNDLQLAVDPAVRKGVIPGAMCWGGDLVRQVGWWALPGVRQAGIDDAWVHICHRIFSVKRYRDDVIVEHMSYKNDKRPKDETDNWERDGKKYIERDFSLYWRWYHSDEPIKAVIRIRLGLKAAGYDITSPAFQGVNF